MTAGASFSPLAYFLQCVPAESAPVLENVVESMQRTQLPPLLLMVDGWRCQSGLRRQGRSERGRGRGEILLLLSVREVPGPSFLRSHHHLHSSSSSSSCFLLTDLPAHAAQLLQSTSTFALPLTSWICCTSHPAVTATTSSSANFRTLHQHPDNHLHSNLSATWKRGACVAFCRAGGGGGGR